MIKLLNFLRAFRGANSARQCNAKLQFQNKKGRTGWAVRQTGLWDKDMSHVLRDEGPLDKLWPHFSIWNTRRDADSVEGKKVFSESYTAAAPGEQYC